MASNKDRFIIPSAYLTYSRNKFFMRHSHKTTFFHGQCVPFDAVEVLPGDTFKLSIASLIRMSTPIFPIMSRITMHFGAYFIPNRLLWEHWEEFMGANKTGAWYNLNNFNLTIPRYTSGMHYGYCISAIDPTGTGAVFLPANDGSANAANDGYIQFLNGAGAAGNYVYVWDVPNSIGAYLMSPVTVSYPRGVSCLYGRSYFIVWNNNYRNQNTTAPIPVDLSSNNDVIVSESSLLPASTTAYNLQPLPLGKYPDYFTKTLPGPQKAPAVTFLPDLVPVGSIPTGTGTTSGNVSIYLPSGSSVTDGTFKQFNVGNDSLFSSPNNLAVANLADNAINTINALRTAFQLQKFFEKDARGGTRYHEMLNAHFGTAPSSAVLQLPEFLGELNFNINVDQVLSNSGYASGSSTTLGAVGANSTTGGKGHIFTKSFQEHGILLVVGGTRHEHTYPAGLHRQFTRYKREHFYDPVFANIGEQPVYEYESYSGSNSTNVLGAQEAWADYRFLPDRVTGLINPLVPNNLSFMTLSDKIGAGVIDDSFIYEDRTSISDSLVTGHAGPDFVADIFFDLVAVREMPLFSIPGYADHH